MPGAGELYRDDTPAHPMSKTQDRSNRLSQMAYLSERRNLVLGSETAGAWANRVLAFSHGSSTPATWLLWPLERDRTVWGRYAPQARPEFMFASVDLPPDALRGMFDPAYRLPLYEAVLHDSVISLDRWEVPLYKVRNAKTNRILLVMLYNTPPNVNLDGQALAEHGDEIAQLQRFFDPLHRAAATKPLTEFRWLTSDRLVQRTSFGGSALTVTANFGNATFHGLRGGCVQAQLAGKPARTLCP